MTVVRRLLRAHTEGSSHSLASIIAPVRRGAGSAVSFAMTGLEKKRWLFAAAAATVWLGVGSGQASAQGGASDAPGAGSLQAQVRELTALVQSLAEKDQAQIQALQAQVKSLQAQLDQQAAVATAAPAGGQTAEPRVAQNAPGFAIVSNSPQQAGQSEIAQPRVTQNESHIFSLQSPDGQYSISLAGVAQFDAGDYLSFRPDSKVVGPQALSNGINARRARIGVAGTAAGGWSYAFIYDGGNSQDTTAKGIETAQIVYGGIKGVALEVGYSNTFFTLDQSTSGNDLLFLERATPSDIATAFNTGDFRSNAGVRLFSDRYWLGAYVTGPASGDSHTLTAERFGAFQRAAYQVLKGPDYSLHLGVGVDELFQGPNSGNGTPDTLSLSDQPELRIDPTALLNTGTIGTTAHPVTGGYVLDLESAATFKGLTWQGEYYHYQVDRQGVTDASFDGGYGQVAWALTGETHKYNPQAASYYRIVPRHPFSLKDGGLGAWEIAGRVSYIDLNSNYAPREALSAYPAAVDGGRQAGYTLGLNWYPNDLVRFMLDYNHVDFDKANGAAVAGAALGVPVGAHMNAISLRSQIVF